MICEKNGLKCLWKISRNLQSDMNCKFWTSTGDFGTRRIFIKLMFKHVKAAAHCVPILLNFGTPVAFNIFHFFMYVCSEGPKETARVCDSTKTICSGSCYVWAFNCNIFLVPSNLTCKTIASS